MQADNPALYGSSGRAGRGLNFVRGGVPFLKVVPGGGAGPTVNVAGRRPAPGPKDSGGVPVLHFLLWERIASAIE